MASRKSRPGTSLGGANAPLNKQRANKGTSMLVVGRMFLLILIVCASLYSTTLLTSGTDMLRDLEIIEANPEQAMKLASLLFTNTELVDSNSKNSATGNLPEITANVPDAYRTALVDCAQLRQKHANVPDPNANEEDLSRYIAFTDKTRHPFYVSLHNFKYDKTRAIIKHRGRYYETVLQDRWGEILARAPPEARVLDVGGNIGYYALFSASFGPFAIDSFEPNPVNLFRVCESLQLNNWTANEFNATRRSTMPAINMWQMGASDAAGRLKFDPYPTANPGAGMIVSDTTPNGAASTLIEIQVTTLDDFAQARGWLEHPARIEIMKIDVEKHESQVLLGAKRLLATKQVRHIFMEFTIDLVKSSENRARQTDALQALVDAGYHLCAKGGFKGPTTPSPFDSRDPQLVTKLMDSLTSAVNLWWQAELPCWKP